MDPERSSIDDIIDLYKKDVDFTLIESNLRLTVEERARKFLDFMNFVGEIRGTAARSQPIHDPV